jgi:glutaredoxin
MNNTSYRRYFVALLISGMIFFTGFLSSNVLTSKKLDSVKNVEDNISLSILSSETEYEILKEASCSDSNSLLSTTKQTTLTKEIGDLAEKLEMLEGNDDNDARILSAKKRYTLLLIKDYLLSKKISEDCKTKPTFVIYFYGNADICPDCVRTSSALTSLRNDFENLRVYAFDMNLDLPLIKTFANIYGIKNESLPALVIDKKVYGGLTNKESIEKLLPKEIKINNSTSSKKTSYLFKLKNG